jgi:hypothetical protein
VVSVVLAHLIQGKIEIKEYALFGGPLSGALFRLLGRDEWWPGVRATATARSDPQGNYPVRVLGCCPPYILQEQDKVINPLETSLLSKGRVRCYRVASGFQPEDGDLFPSWRCQDPGQSL